MRALKYSLQALLFPISLAGRSGARLGQFNGRSGTVRATVGHSAKMSNGPKIARIAPIRTIFWTGSIASSQSIISEIFARVVGLKLPKTFLSPVTQTRH